MQPPIALLTDFGTTDIYVGVMKGVMLGICPDVIFADITHAIGPQNVRQGAFALLNSYRFFPRGTIFLVVVDPGVGSARKAIVAEAGGYRFVAPDNGVIGYALQEIGEYRAFESSNPQYRLKDVSNTFHGRDIFAPAAAHVARGVDLTSFGQPVPEPVMLPRPALDIAEGRVSGEVVHIDHFGNLVTSIGPFRWVSASQLVLDARRGSAARNTAVFAPTASVRYGGQQIDGIKRTYSEVGQGRVLAMIGSNGYLEISVNQASAVERLGGRLGDTVELVLT